MVAVGADRVLIGAPYNDAGATDAGAAYLFSTNGSLLKAFTNSAPETGDRFGFTLASAGTNELLIAAILDNRGAADAGAVYLFSTAVPALTIRLTTTNTVAVSWPSTTDWKLQQNTSSVSSVHWSNAPGMIQDNGTTMTLTVNPPRENRFYRLIRN